MLKTGPIKHAPLDRLVSGPIPRHRHAYGYATIVLSGQYIEAGDTGRFKVREGDVLVHEAFEAHQNHIAPTGAVVLNFAVPDDYHLPSAFRMADPEGFLNAAHVDSEAAIALLIPYELIAPLHNDWPDQLAADIQGSPSLSLGQWAERHSMDPATVSRGFKRIYGISPAQFRAEARARRALAALRSTTEPLAMLAQDLGFADQAHMTRSVRALSQFTPAQWRKVKSVQD